MRDLKIKNTRNFSNVKTPICWIRVVMLAVYTMQISMSITYNQYQGLELKEPDNVINHHITFQQP